VLVVWWAGKVGILGADALSARAMRMEIDENDRDDIKDRLEGMKFRVISHRSIG
jgi:hypothetical protein